MPCPTDYTKGIASYLADLDRRRGKEGGSPSSTVEDFEDSFVDVLTDAG